jgi:hypothetical protein
MPGVEPGRPTENAKSTLSPDQLRKVRALQREITSLSSPLMKGRFPMDGVQGLVAIFITVIVLVVVNVGMIRARDFLERDTGVVMMITSNVALACVIVWGICVRRSERRLRRLREGKCAWCGYSLADVRGDECPVCRSPAVRAVVDWKWR